MAARFRVFRRSIIAREEVVIKITQAAVALHNFLMHNRTFLNSNTYCPSDFIDRDGPSGTTPGQWRNEVQGDTGLTNCTNLGSRNYSRDAKTVRDNFRDFFLSPMGQVPWQNEMI